jgi:hypothetical protein
MAVWRSFGDEAALFEAGALRTSLIAIGRSEETRERPAAALLVDSQLLDRLFQRHSLTGLPEVLAYGVVD